MAGQGTVTIKILGDAKGAIAALGDVGAKADGLHGKLAALGKVFVATGALAVSSFAAVGVGLFKIGESFDEQYDKIRVGTGQTGDALNALQDDFRNVVKAVPTDFGRAGDAITKLVQVLGVDAGPALDQLTEQFLELSRITKTDLTTNLDAGSRALMGWNIPIGQYSAKLDELFRTTQLTGVSFADLTSGLNDSGLVLRALGLSFDQSLALLGALGKAGLSASDVLPAMTKSLAVALKQGKTAGDVFKETFDAIKSGAPGAEKAALDVFGAKGAGKFVELIREGKLNYEDLMGAIANGSDTIIGAGKETQHFSEKWQQFKNRVLVALEPLATKVFDGMGKAMDKLGPYVDKFSKWFSDNMPQAIAAIQAKIDEWWPTVVAAFAVIQAWVEQHWPEIQKIIADVVDTIVAVVSGAVDLIQTIWSNFGDNILEYVQRVWPAVQQQIEGALAIIRGIVQTITALIHGDWGKFWDGITGTVGGAFEYIKGTIGQNFEAIRLLVGAALEIVGAIFKDAWDRIQSGVADAFRWVLEFFKSLPGQIISFIAGLPAALFGLGADMATSFLNGIKSALGISATTSGVGLEAVAGQATKALGGSGTETIKKIGKYDTGGMVPGPVGMAQLAIVHGGERVQTPEQQRSGMGSSFNFHEGSIQVVQAPGENAADALPRELRAMAYLMAS